MQKFLFVIERLLFGTTRSGSDPVPANSAVNKLDEDVRNALQLLLDKGGMGAGVFQTPDCHATYEELKSLRRSIQRGTQRTILWN